MASLQCLALDQCAECLLRQIAVGEYPIGPADRRPCLLQPRWQQQVKDVHVGETKCEVVPWVQNGDIFRRRCLVGRDDVGDIDAQRTKMRQQRAAVLIVPDNRDETDIRA